MYQLLGTPDAHERQWLQQQPDFDKIVLRCTRHVPLADALPDAPDGALQLAARMLRYAAPQRVCAADALADGWFMQLPLPRRDDVFAPA